MSVDCEQSDKHQLPFLHQYKLVFQRQITELQFLDQAFCVSNLEIVLVRTCFVGELGLRVPSGYSMTGGDLIPMVFDWMPIFPTMRVRAGSRVIWDLSAIDGTGGHFSTRLEFDAVKRTGGNR